MNRPNSYISIKKIFILLFLLFFIILSMYLYQKYFLDKYIPILHGTFVYEKDNYVTLSFDKNDDFSYYYRSLSTKSISKKLDNTKYEKGKYSMSDNSKLIYVLKDGTLNNHEIILDSELESLTIKINGDQCKFIKISSSALIPIDFRKKD
ncbi:hypothetical protein WG909_15165 (plasmid) [Peptostreptococcaceae bacterium AGR-M142]